MQELCLQIACVLDEIAKACDLVASEARLAGFDERGIHHCYLAVEEACTNIVEHGLRGDDHNEACIEVCCQREQDRLIIKVIDTGAAFDPLTVPDPDPKASIDERSEGGWGIYFIKKLMDEVAYRVEGGRNYLTMIKRVAQPTQSISAEPPERREPKFAQVVRSGGAVVFALSGYWDRADALALSDAINKQLENGRQQFVLDFADVLGMNSSAMKALIKLWQHVRDRRGQIVLTRVPANLYELFELSGLDLIFHITPSLEVAEQKLARRPLL